MLQLDYSRSVDSPEVSLLLQGHSPCRIERHPSAHGGTGGAGGAGRPPPPPAMAVLAAHPTEALAASAGSDRTLRLWGLRQKQMVAMRALPAPAAALAFSAGGELAAALHGGGVLLLEARRLTELPVDLMAGLPAGAWRTSRALGFSPDGAVLAVGTDAGSIELFVARWRPRCGRRARAWAAPKVRAASARGAPRSCAPRVHDLAHPFCATRRYDNSTA